MTPDELDEIERTITGVDAAYGPGEQRTEMHRLITALRGAWAERDEAMGKHLSSTLFQEYGRLDAAWQQLVRERDEARAEVERLRVLLRFVRDDAKSMEEAVAAAEDVDHD